MTDQYVPSLSHLVYDQKHQQIAMEEDDGVPILKYHKEAESYSPGRFLVDINNLTAQAKSKGELQKGATIIQLNGNQVRNLSTKAGPMLNYPQLENELKRLIAIVTLLGNDYTQVMNKVTTLISSQVLNIMGQNLDTAVANFYAIFRNFKIVSLQKELTQQSVVERNGENVTINHTPEFLGGWYLVQLQSGIGSQQMQSYWINDISASIPANPAGVQPYGREQVLNTLELCGKLVSMDWNYQNKLQKNEIITRIQEAKVRLENTYNQYRGGASSEQASKIMDIYKKTELLEDMMSFSADVAQMTRPATATAVNICEQSIVRMTVHHTV